MRTDPRVEGRKAVVPLTTRGVSPYSPNNRRKQINSPTSNRCLITDGGTTVEHILDDNDVGEQGGLQGDYLGTGAACEALETSVSEHVDAVITWSRSIDNSIGTDTHTRAVGKTHVAGILVEVVR